MSFQMHSQAIGADALTSQQFPTPCRNILPLLRVGGARGLDRLAAAGNSGRNPKNMQRAMMSAFGWPTGAPNFVWHDIPMAGHDRAQPHPFICPHELFSRMYADKIDFWDVAIRGDEDSSAKFWAESQLDPDIKNHPALQTELARKYTIPLGMHGDGGAFSHHDSLLTISWNSLVGSGITLRKRFVFTTSPP